MRTQLMRRVRRSLFEARAAAGAPVSPQALTRRQAIILATAAAAGACATRGGIGNDSIAIVGGGAAGLTAAYRLNAGGRNCAVFEAASRVGGRMFTRRNFNADGQFCELGGELVDSNHESLISLAKELGVEIQRIAEDGEKDADLYDIGGALRRQHDMFDPATGTGAFAPIIGRIAADQSGLLDYNGDWTDKARALDDTSLKDYLDGLRPLTERWAIDLLDLAYQGEYGLPTAEQSALNFIELVGAETAEPFRIFGVSDEAHRIAGGSSSLIEALAAKLKGRADTFLRHELVEIAATGFAVELIFKTPRGQKSVRVGQAVVTLPFTRLRQVRGLEALGLSTEKLTAIRELGYGQNAKLMVGTRARPWRDAGDPAPFAGALYSDRGAQIVWETSRGQAGESGVLTNFTSADRSDMTEEALAASLRDNLAALSPATAGSIDPNIRAAFFWNRYAQTLGSYACARPGQYTRLLEATGTPELNGRLFFAGEHTSAEFQGFMNGAVDSGERAAAEILEA